MILAVLSILVLVVGTMTFLYPAAVFPDSSWGFQVLQKMQAGGGFNLLIKPNPADISKSHTEFLTWWSPGQYLAPYLFKSLFKLNLGQSAAITTTVFTLSGIFGFYSFFKRAGFGLIIAAISVALIACQQAFILPYVFYNGGEVLIFGFGGWFLYGCTAIDKTGWKLVVFLLLSGCLGFFCKSSFLWMYGAGCIYLWIKLSKGQQNIIEWIKKGIWIGIPAIAALALIFTLYLSKGENPASSGMGIKLTWQAFSFPLASPLLAGLSIDDMVGGLIYHDDVALLTPFWSLLTVIAAAIFSVILVINIVRRVPNKSYTLLVIVFYSVSVIFFSYNYLRQVNISYEARHLRIIGLLITPGLVYLVSRAHLTYQAAFIFISFVIGFLSFKYFVPGFRQNQLYNARGTSGLAQVSTDQQSLNRIMELDKENNNAIFVFTQPDLGLEIKNNRLIIVDPLDAVEISTKEYYETYTYKGHAGPVYILLPSTYTGVRSSIITHCFPGYNNFKMEQLTPDYTLFSAK
ncbi:MAG: hypothetical protein AAGC65_16485 [Mucilaginibacter sp.]|uniref:hypothetical protein n=1 Tax=Mucilaginibacter sp. TaxID=1882438 RepID=UPI0031A74A54